MRHYKCKCGKSEYWESGIPPMPCQGCNDCNTQYGTYNGEYREREEHQWEPRFNEKTGEPDRPICKRCYERKKDVIEKD